MARPGPVTGSAAIERDLSSLFGSDAVLPGSTREYLADTTESRNVRGRADAVVLPRDAEQVKSAVRWCYEHDVPVVPRGGGTGLAGGAVPLDGGVVISLERLRAVPRIEPELWRASVEAGVTTAVLQRRARENGLFFPPDPGAAEQSQIGGNIATNAGGPHSFKYGVTGAFVTGLEAVVPPGELVSVGGQIRKDVAGYDIKSLLVGSEGTLGLVTGAWLKLVPAPEAAFPVAVCYRTSQSGCEAIRAVLGSGLQVAALEYLDNGTMQAAGASFPATLHDDAGFMLVAEADGSTAEAARLRAELIEVLGDGGLTVHAPEETRAITELWRWRAGVSLVVTAQRGGKVSEDIVVPVDRLCDAIEGTLEIGRRHQLAACSWGHAGDGNLHSTFMIAPDDLDEVARAERATDELFALARELGGSVSGEHGVGWVKRGALALQWSPSAVALHEAIKKAFDPKGLMNPGKKLARL
jgi:glycolate oxidase subunit GlcD